MDRFKTQYETGQIFEPQSWLADEMLWGIVKEPFDIRWRDRWTAPADSKNDESAIMKSLWGRAKLYNNFAKENDPRSLALAALNIGKLAAGLTSHVVHFEANPKRWKNDPSDFTEDILHAANRVVGSIVDIYPRIPIETDADGDVFENMLLSMDIKAREISFDSIEFPIRRANGEELSDLAVEAFYVAKGGVATFIDYMRKHDGKFIMEPGGTPRSGGRIIEERVQIFDTIPRPWTTSS